MKGSNKKLGHQGFSLVEILVALALMAVVFTIVPLTTTDKRAQLEEAILDFDRAVKVATNESILRNTVTRIFINLEFESEESDAPSVKYSVQFGPDGGLALPRAADLSKISLKDLEKYEERQKSFNSKFNSVPDFKPRALPEGITFQGLASSYQKEIQNEGKIAIYFYPTGEKDDAIIFLASNNELAYLEVEAFRDETTLEYYPLNQSELENPQESLDNKKKEIYSQWLKD